MVTEALRLMWVLCENMQQNSLRATNPGSAFDGGSGEKCTGGNLLTPYQGCSYNRFLLHYGDQQNSSSMAHLLNH